MSTSTPLAAESVVYPDSDGKPMADNTKQFGWISRIKWGLEHMYRHDPDVFVAGDLLWYPIEHEPKIRAAPDAMVAFGRPKGDRGSYKQWCEDDVAPQVVFEVLSPGNTKREMANKLKFYETHGVAEYYQYDPDNNEFAGWIRDQGELVQIDGIENWSSPRLGIRFELTDLELAIYSPDGEPFDCIEDVFEGRHREKQERARADRERARADRERARADRARARAEQERAHEKQEREAIQAERDELAIEVARMREQLKQLGSNSDGSS